jgi:hypothetical protein
MTGGHAALRTKGSDSFIIPLPVMLKAASAIRSSKKPAPGGALSSWNGWL